MPDDNYRSRGISIKIGSQTAHLTPSAKQININFLQSLQDLPKVSHQELRNAALDSLRSPSLESLPMLSVGALLVLSAEVLPGFEVFLHLPFLIPFKSK
jgi:hypothetical protein